MSGAWRSEIEEFVALTKGRWTQSEIAMMDQAFEQKDISRWQAGKYERQPTGPKMAGIRRVVRGIKEGPGEYERGVLDAVAEIRERLTALSLRALATSGDADMEDVGASEAARARRKRSNRRPKKK